MLSSQPPLSPGVVKTLGKHGQGKSRVQLQHELLDAAKGALDRSCHLVSSFGSESQLTADPACLAGANVSLSRPPQPALLLHTPPCREKAEHTQSERTSPVELIAGATSS